MTLRLVRRPATGADEFPASLVNRALRANGYTASRPNRKVITAAVVENPVNGYLDIIKQQQLCAAMMFSRRSEQEDDTWLAGALCTACIAEGSKLSMIAAHPYFAVCVRHGIKLHAYCPNCRTPTSWTWLVHQRCQTCRTAIIHFSKLPCNEAEACTAQAVHAWLSGASESPTVDILAGLWSVPLTQRPSVLRSLVSTALPRPKDPSFAEQQCYFTACRDWLLSNAANWRFVLIAALAQRFPPPRNDTGFLAACRWLGRALNQGEVASTWPLPVPTDSFRWLPALLAEDFLVLVDRARTHSSHEPGDVRLPTVHAIRRPKLSSCTCQWSLKLPGYYQSQKAVVSLRRLNRARPKKVRHSSEQVPVQRSARAKRFQFQTHRQQSLDAFELLVRRLVVGSREKSEHYISLGEIEHALPERQLMHAETAIANQLIRCYLIDKTGNYRNDIGVTRQALATWQAKQEGGQYVIPLCA
ncbi:hypothetical protein HPT27_03150 [Permianibacter sp. IMCC34836]|uniref:hypothetical protein n=1 Tax=Permianibacter fluminis TaxID=2738515 RepID=UPI00155284CD|nr:hypothetical protein [Permianibacter fluminis]NQD36005.1 hypothetical protein [Permianibacter fluminis]